MRRFLCLAVACLCPGFVQAAKPTVDYLREIKPILNERCVACHGTLQQKNGLRLDTATFLKKGGASGPAIEIGKSDESLLILAVTGGDGAPKMPPEGEGTALSREQIALLKNWIDQGATAPEEKLPEDPRRHWAFQKVVRPAVPKVKSPEWQSNPIDAFLAADWEKRGLVPTIPADKGTLLRRVYVDLIGLPPSRSDLHDFLNDSSPDAYEKVVDRLLASPQHAERWGRHWMDVWRYSDWYGRREINEQRNGRRHIWRWRDWIIDSLQADKGYDEMLREMLAADELYPGNLDAQRASGYLGRNYYLFNRSVWMQDTVEHVGMGFLGLTFKCCRCHDHKYDPISQAEYYRLRNVFEPIQARTDRIPGKPEEFKSGKPQTVEPAPGGMLIDGYDCIYDADPQAITYLLRRGNDKDPDKNRPMAAGVPAVLGGELSIKAVNVPPDSFYPSMRTDIRREIVADFHREVEKAAAALKTAKGQEKIRAELKLEVSRKKFASIETRIAADTSKYGFPTDSAVKPLSVEVAAMQDRANSVAIAKAELALAEHEFAIAKSEIRPVITRSLRDFQNAEKALAKAKEGLTSAEKAKADKGFKYESFGKVYPQTSSGRRLAFARWLTRPENPLTARVAVNHIWARHFGAGIVTTTHNFGLNGKRPVHPELLDWLAAEFVTPSGSGSANLGGWRMKRLHRLIVTSHAYRRTSAESATDDRNLQLDPENKYLWRMNPRRMEAEVVRDGLLALSGGLDLTRGGADIDPLKADQVPRRSLYFTICPDTRALMLEQFDVASPLECYLRTESIIPQQALALANGGLSFSQTRLMARTLSRSKSEIAASAAAEVTNNSESKNVSDDEFVTRVYELVLCRVPSPQERARCVRFLKEQPRLLSDKANLTPFTTGESASVKPSADLNLRARENLVHVLLNSNEFVTVR